MTLNGKQSGSSRRTRSAKLGSPKHEGAKHWGWMLLAVVAIGVALLLMLVPHPHSGNTDFAAILPLLVVGILSPLSLLAPLAHGYAGRVPQAPALAVCYQRPPPLDRG